MKILVTGSAGFIGAALTEALLKRGDVVIGIDNHNDYYDQNLKEARIARFLSHKNYTHLRIDISNRQAMSAAFEAHNPQCVVNLAAQAGVRYSLENPATYIDSNIVGFANVLDGCRMHNIDHLIYASSSSVYGTNTVYPYSVDQNVDNPISLYAATKKSNELMAHAYSHLYGLPTTGLRLFTVYGPWGRPDMALFKFTKAILEGKPIQLFNEGKHRRDFTYIDDVIIGLLLVIDRPPLLLRQRKATAPYEIYNVGSGSSVELMRFVDTLESALDRKTVKEYLPAQLGDVANTQSDMHDFKEQFRYVPTTDIHTGIPKFVDWYLRYFQRGDLN